MARLPSTMTVPEVCMQAWIIGQHGGWCQGSYRRGSTRCLVGLLNEAMNHSLGTNLPAEIVQTLHAHLMATSDAYGALVLHEQASHVAGRTKNDTADWIPSNSILIRWNDHEGRSASELLDTLWTIGMSGSSAFPQMDEDEGILEESIPEKEMAQPKSAPAMV